MLKDKRVYIRILMTCNRNGIMFYNYSPDADIIVSTCSDWEELYPNNESLLDDTAVHIEFIVNKHDGTKYVDIRERHMWRIIGRKREYIT